MEKDIQSQLKQYSLDIQIHFYSLKFKHLFKYTNNSFMVR